MNSCSSKKKLESFLHPNFQSFKTTFRHHKGKKPYITPGFSIKCLVEKSLLMLLNNLNFIVKWEFFTHNMCLYKCYLYINNIWVTFINRINILCERYSRREYETVNIKNIENETNMKKSWYFKDTMRRSCFC